jgi:hypothetical protein
MFRVACLLIGSVALSNVRWIQRYRLAQAKDEMTQPVTPSTEKNPRKQAGVSFWASVRTSLAALCNLARPKIATVGC